MSRLLFTPGPTNVHPDVLQALLVGNMSHREAAFSRLLDRILETMPALFGGHQTHVCVPFVCSGTGANEAMLASVHGRLLVLETGRYSCRITDLAHRLGIPTQSLPWTPSADATDRVNEVLSREGRITHVFVVHLETTTGELAPLTRLAEVVARHGVYLLVDTISSIGGHDLHLERDHIDFCSVNPNKCLEGVPGLAFVLGRERLISELEGRSRSYYFDLHGQWRSCTTRGETLFTSAVHLFHSFDVALRRLEVEGVERRAQRYRALRDHLEAGLLLLGFRRAPLPPESRSNMLSVLIPPAGVSYEQLRQTLASRGAIIHSHPELVERGWLGLATMGHLTLDDVDWFVRQVDAVITQAT